MKPDLYSLIPQIKRARAYRIYDENGRRLLDLFQDNGSSILGHRPERVILAMKGSLSRGLTSGYPVEVHLHRLAKAVAALIPGFPFIRFFRSDIALARALSDHIGKPTELVDIPDPPREELSIGAGLARWRPFLEHLPWDQEVLLPVLPFPADLGPRLALFRREPAVPFDPSSAPSALVLAGLTRAVYDLIRYQQDCDRETWKSFDIGPWRRTGPYLLFDGGESEYGALFAGCLDRGILLSPEFPGPSIVPGEFTSGEVKALRELPRR